MSALCLALLVYAAIPHVHGDGAAHGAAYAYAFAGAGAEAEAAVGHRPAPPIAALPTIGILLADEAHESHSSRLALDAHPCTLCRDESARTLPTQPAQRPSLEACGSSPCPPPPGAPRPERPLAERHPARAPPIA